MIHLERVTRTFAGPPPRTVLADVTLDVAAGELVAIVGESGTGKSTLLNLVAGLDRPDTGSVNVDGVALTALDDDALTRFRRKHVGFVFQAFHVLPYLTVAQNVMLPLALLGASGSAAEARVAEMLRAVGLADRGNSMPRELSGGELQRTAIARALVHRPVDRAGRRAHRQPRSGERHDGAGAAARARAGGRRHLPSRDAFARRGRARRSRRDAVRHGARRNGLRREREARTREGSFMSALAWSAVTGGAFAHQRGRLVLAIGAIALGVGLGFAVALVNASAVEEFGSALRTLAGAADIEIRGPRNGFDEMAYARVARDPDVVVASPVVEVDARIEGREEALRIYGIDAFRAAAVTPALIGEGGDPLDLLRPGRIFVSPPAARVARPCDGRHDRSAERPRGSPARGRRAPARRRVRSASA